MAPMKSSTQSKSSRNGTTRPRHLVLWKPVIQKMRRCKLRKIKKQSRKKLRRGLDSNLRALVVRSSLNQVESSRQSRRLRLQFSSKLPDVLFTNDILYHDHGAEPKVPLRIDLLNENNTAVNQGHLSSLRIEVFVVHGDLKAEASEHLTREELQTSIIVHPRKEKLLLVGSRERTLQNGVCFFDDLKFVDNSSWVPTKTFQLMVRVAENAQLPVIKLALSGPFRVKDQHGKSTQKPPIPSCDDKVQQLMKIGKECYQRLKAEGIHSVKDFLRKYNIDQSSLHKILGVKDKVWETIVQHATKCSPNDELFRYDREGVELLFNCFYDLVYVSFDHQNVVSLDTLGEPMKNHVEQLRRCALEDVGQLVPVTSFSDWPYAKPNTLIVPDPNPQDPIDTPQDSHQVESVSLNEYLLSCPHFPESLLDTHQHLETETHLVATVEGFGSQEIDFSLWDLITVSDLDHPVYSPDVNVTENYMGHEQALIWRPGEREPARVLYRVIGIQILVHKFAIALRSNRTR